MTAAETLDLARSHGVEVRLNDAGDGLDLEVETDPPQALLSIIRRACLACRSQREGGLDRLNAASGITVCTSCAMMVRERPRRVRRSALGSEVTAARVTQD